MRDLPFVSVIVPCFNEVDFIGACLDSIIGGIYPTDRMEVLVVDGMSRDGTRAILEDYARRHPFIHILDNPRRITAAALNVGIARARGEVIAWMSAHNRYARDYLKQAVEHLEAYGADNVGGVLVTVPREETLIGRAIACALSHPFGVGNSYTKIHVKEPRWFDAVFGGCYRREVFERVGLFNERLVRGQDMEFHIRLRKAGGRILLAPAVVSYYYARADLASFFRQNWSNGIWAVLPFLYSSVIPVSWRHLVPLGFVGGLLASAALAAVMPPGRWLLGGLGGLYLVANLAASAHVALRERNLRYLAAMPLVFGALHIAYGLGSLWGVARAARISTSRPRARRPRGPGPNGRPLTDRDPATNAPQAGRPL